MMLSIGGGDGTFLEVMTQPSAAAQTLPVWGGKDRIVARVRDHDTIVLVGETGSGKTTQIPQFLLREGIVSGRAMIGVTQPRRVAATSLARRVAAEMGCVDPATLPTREPSKPQLVGYSVRFDDRTTRHTRIKFLTDGMLIREVLGPGNTDEANAKRANALLKRYGVIIIDEAHERSLRTDMLLGLVKRIQYERRRLYEAGEPGITPLKVIIMSATIDASTFASFFGATVPILYVAGRQHAVRMYHTEQSCQDWTDAAVHTVMQIHVSKPAGDILVFATGQEEIEAIAQSLTLYASQVDAWAAAEGVEKVPALLVRPLYAALGPAASAAVFAPTPPNARKVVLATNIAETSITIPGVRYVVDSGLVKEKTFSPQTGIETLQVLPVSQTSSLQRAGRAGREGPGECFRLYTKEAFHTLRPAPVAEIHRTELSGAALQLYAMGIEPFTFDWIDPPDTALLQEAVLHLAELGAIETPKGDGGVRLTPLGQKLALFPLAPTYARLMVAAAERGPRVARQARDLVSLLTADRGVFVESNDAEKREAAEQARDAFFDASGDHATMLNALSAYLAASERAHATHSTPLAARHELRLWCQTHSLHERTMKNVLSIRKQLMRICLQQGIACDDDAHSRPSKPVPERDEAEQDGDALLVTRGGGAVSTFGYDREDYLDLLQCLGMGRLSNVALRQPDRTFRRIAGGQTFKLHPSSVLHPTRHGARGTSAENVQAIVFEELVLTSQTFARTVSKIEPAWLQTLTTPQ